MKNMKLTIQYDGSNYHGWQKQNDRKTVEGQVLRAIKILTKEDVILSTAGRTDKGVHAYGQVANFFVEDKYSTDNIRRGINSFLVDDDIQVVKVEEVDGYFHSRFSAKGKRYRYILNNDRLMHPKYRRYKGNIPYDLDIDKIKECSQILVGTHNFSSFTKNVIEDEVNLVRTIDSIKIEKEGYDIIFTFEAESFLRNMVRIIVGSLVEVGRGKRDVQWIEKALREHKRKNAGPTISPSGLYLMEVYY